MNYPWNRVIVDFFGYLVFILSSYIIFGTDMSFRWFLIPVTLIAFFYTLSNRYKEAFEEGFGSAELVLSDMVELFEDEEEDD